MSNKSKTKNNKDEGKRDFLVVSTYAMAGIGAASFAWPLIDQMNPAADTLALASTEIDLSSLEEGQAITVKWRGKPVFVRYRTDHSGRIRKGPAPTNLAVPSYEFLSDTLIKIG